MYFQMDSKASPLAMLAKTCSLIGADPIGSNNKSGLNLKKNSPDTIRHRNSPSSGSVSVSDTKSFNQSDSSIRSPNRSKSRSRSSSTEIKVTDNLTVNNKKTTSPLLKSNSLSENHVPPPPSASGLPTSTVSSSTKALPPSVSYPSTTTAPSTGSSTSAAAALLNNPFLASFASSLQQSHPESRIQDPGSGLTGGSIHQSAAAAAAAAANHSVCRDPLCRDPLCPTALRNQHHLNNFTYSSLLTSPYYKEAMMAFTLQQRMAALAAAPHEVGAGRSLPHVCNWVAGKKSNPIFLIFNCQLAKMISCFIK